MSYILLQPYRWPSACPAQRGGDLVSIGPKGYQPSNRTKPGRVILEGLLLQKTIRIANMASPVHLDEEQIEDFRVICNLPEDKLREVVARLKSLPVAPTPLNKLFEAISDILQDNGEAAMSIFRQMSPVVGWLRHEQGTVAQLMASVRDTLTLIEGWDNQKWIVVEGILTDLFSVRTIYLSASAVDLSFEHVNLFRGARILTDIRPIFNEEATAIEGSVISHTLRLRFENTQGRHELTFALEESDVKQFANQCERALGKARLALSMMTNGARVPTIISGGIDNE